MKIPGILLIENSLDDALIPELIRRSQYITFQGMQKSLDVDFKIYHERIHDLNGLKRVLSWCEGQNKMTNSSHKNGQFKEATSIEFIHISSHGTKLSLELPKMDGSKLKTTEDDLVEAFSVLKNSKIKTVVLSSCDTGQNSSLARRILENTKVKAVIAYPETAYDHVCAISEQLLYYQLIAKSCSTSFKIQHAVRKANDSLILIGEKPNRCMVCWVKEKKAILGPCPWWDYDGDDYQRSDRSYVSSLINLIKADPKLISQKKLLIKIMECL